MRSYYRKYVQEYMRKPVLNKKEERSLRRQQLASVVSEDSMPALDQPVVIVDTVKPVVEEDSVATVKDWELRMVHQEIRLAQVANEAQRRNLPIPEEWIVYEAKLLRQGPPAPPPSLMSEGNQ
jgi:hypothetical protein